MTLNGNPRRIPQIGISLDIRVPERQLSIPVRTRLAFRDGLELKRWGVGGGIGDRVPYREVHGFDVDVVLQHHDALVCS